MSPFFTFSPGGIEEGSICVPNSYAWGGNNHAARQNYY